MFPKKILRANLFVLVFLWRNTLKILLLNGKSPSQHWIENIFWFRLKPNRKSRQNSSFVLSAYLIWIKYHISSTYLPGLLPYCYTTSSFREKKKIITAFQLNWRKTSLWDRGDEEKSISVRNRSQKLATALLQTANWTIMRQWAAGELQAPGQLKSVQGGVQSCCSFPQIFC